MSRCQFLLGDVYDRLAEIEDASVDLIVTSPPFLALRSYLPADHPDKHKEIGSEATPAAFLSTLLALTREWRRVLAPHGSIAVELGDTYASSGEGMRAVRVSPDVPTRGLNARSRGSTKAEGEVIVGGGAGWPLPKSLCLIPSLYAGSLAYGHNLLDPDDTITPWKIRNLIVWHRPNPPVGALGDKVRPSTSYITVGCVSGSRWFDLDAERGEGSPNAHARGPKAFGYARVAPEQVTGSRNDDGLHAYSISNPAGAPPLDCWIDGDVWTIPTQPYKGAHYATYPIALPRRLINLMCPREVCTVCGEPRRRITDNTRYDHNGNVVTTDFMGGNRDNGINNKDAVIRWGHNERNTLGWTDCHHNNYRRGVVLDPFAGSGTTGVAASEQGRDSILIDIDERNLHLARARIGLFLDETPPTERTTP